MKWEAPKLKQMTSLNLIVAIGSNAKADTRMAKINDIKGKEWSTMITPNNICSLLLKERNKTYDI